MVGQLVKQLPAFYGTQKTVAVFATELYPEPLQSTTGIPAYDSLQYCSPLYIQLSPIFQSTAEHLHKHCSF